MPASIGSFALLGVAALVAGAVNAIAGGGTLLTFPSLLTVLSPVQANATSTVALLPGSLASALGYRSELAASRPHLVRLLPPSFLGGILGALAVTRFPERVFENMVPWLLLGATILLIAQRPIARWIGRHHHGPPGPSGLAAIVFFQFLVGVYGGYFGAGIGILMLSSLGFVGIDDIHEMNAVKTVLAAAMNGTSVAVFLLEGAVVWRYAAVMVITAILGGYLGARVARKLPASYVRAIVVAIGFAVAGYSFYKRFAQ